MELFPQRSSGRTWTRATRQLTDELEVRRILCRAIDDLHWVVPPVSVPTEVGEAMGAIVEAYAVPELQAVAWSDQELSPCRLLGLEARYTEGAVRHYWLETGEECLPVAMDLWLLQ